MTVVSIYDLVGNRNNIQMNNIFKKDLRILVKHTKKKNKKERKGSPQKKTAFNKGCT